jgi:hypothetical protein
MERHDDDSSDNEDRWQTMGCLTECGDIIRIISARVAEPFERRIYYGDSETRGWERINPEEHEARKARIEAAAKRPYTYDPDSPLLTEKQLSEFRPVNFAAMEERAQYMQNQETPALV